MTLVKQSMWPTIFLVGLLSGCNSSGTGSFQIGEASDHVDCFTAMFPFDPPFLAARDRSGSTGIFIQSRGGNFQNVDLIYFELFQPPPTIGEPLQTSPPGEEEGATILSELQFGESCPDVLDSMWIDGTVTFDAFEDEQNGRVEGSVDGDVVSVVTGEPVATGLTGDFSFLVKRGQPYEEFRRPQ